MQFPCGVSQVIMLAITYEAWTHQLDYVFTCPTQVEYQRVLSTSTTCLRHVILCVPFKKYYFSTWTRLDMAWTCVRHGSDMRQMWLDMARIRLKYDLVLFFPII